MNPGLYARSRYGHGYLRHAQSWRYEGLGSAYDNYESGSWKKVKAGKSTTSLVDKFGKYSSNL